MKTKGGALLSLDYTLPNGQVVEITEASVPSVQPIAPWIKLIVAAGKPPAEIIRSALESIGKESQHPVRPDDFTRVAEEDWHRMTAWVAEIGGYPRAFLKFSHRLGDSEEDRDYLEWLRRDEADKALCNWLRLQSALAFNLDAKLEKLVIIHDDLTPSLLRTTWMYATGDLDRSEQEFAGKSPRGAFATVNRQRGEKLRLVLQKRTGFQADFYLPTELADEPAT